jgi:hypothetical protein
MADGSTPAPVANRWTFFTGLATGLTPAIAAVLYAAAGAISIVGLQTYRPDVLPAMMRPVGDAAKTAVVPPSPVPVDWQVLQISILSRRLALAETTIEALKEAKEHAAPPTAPTPPATLMQLPEDKPAPVKPPNAPPRKPLKKQEALGPLEKIERALGGK